MSTESGAGVMGSITEGLRLGEPFDRTGFDLCEAIFLAQLKTGIYQRSLDQAISMNQMETEPPYSVCPPSASADPI